MSQEDAAISIALRLVDQATAPMTRALGMVERSTSAAENQMRKLESVTNIVTTAFAALTAGLSVAKVIEYADTYKNLEGRLNLVSASAASLADTETRLFTAAQNSRTGYAQSIDLYTRIARSTKELNLGQEKTLSVTDLINKTLVVSGTSAESANAALVQLGQGLAAGTLRGEEFNSVIEQAPRLSQAIADGLGVTIGQLRTMSQAGELTAEAVIKAVLSQGQAIESDFSRMPKTIGQAMTVMDNSLGHLVAGIDQVGGISGAVANKVISLAKGVDDWGQRNRDTIQGTLDLSGRMVDEVGGPIIDITALITAMTAQQWLFNSAALQNPYFEAAAMLVGINELMKRLPGGDMSIESLPKKWQAYTEAMGKLQDSIYGVKREAAGLDLQPAHAQVPYSDLMPAHGAPSPVVGPSAPDIKAWGEYKQAMEGALSEEDAKQAKIIAGFDQRREQVDAWYTSIAKGRSPSEQEAIYAKEALDISSLYAAEDIAVNKDKQDKLAALSKSGNEILLAEQKAAADRTQEIIKGQYEDGLISQRDYIVQRQAAEEKALADEINIQKTTVDNASDPIKRNEALKSLMEMEGRQTVLHVKGANELAALDRDQIDNIKEIDAAYQDYLGHYAAGEEIRQGKSAEARKDAELTAAALAGVAGAEQAWWENEALHDKEHQDALRKEQSQQDDIVKAQIANQLSLIDTQETYNEITTGEAAQRRIDLLIKEIALDQQRYDQIVGNSPEEQQLRNQYLSDLEKENAALLAQKKIIYDHSAWGGMENAIRKFDDEIENTGAVIETSLTNGFDSARDSLTNFYETGVVDFSNLANVARHAFAQIESDATMVWAKAAMTGNTAQMAAAGGNMGTLATMSGNTGYGGLLTSGMGIISELYKPGTYAASQTGLQAGLANGLQTLGWGSTGGLSASYAATLTPSQLASLENGFGAAGTVNSGAAGTVSNMSSSAFSGWSAGIGTFVMSLLNGEDFKQAAAKGLGAGGGAYAGAQAGAYFGPAGAAIGAIGGAILGSFLGGLGGGSGEEEHLHHVEDLSARVDKTWDPLKGLESSNWKPMWDGSKERWRSQIYDAFYKSTDEIDKQFNQQIEDLHGQLSNEAWKAFSDTLKKLDLSPDASGTWGAKHAGEDLQKAMTSYGDKLNEALNKSLQAALPVIAKEIINDSAAWKYLDSDLQKSILKQIKSKTFTSDDLTTLSNYLAQVTAATAPINEILATNGLTKYELSIRDIDQQVAAYADTLKAAGIDLTKYTDLEKVHQILLKQAADDQKARIADIVDPIDEIIATSGMSQYEISLRDIKQHYADLNQQLKESGAAADDYKKAENALNIELKQAADEQKARIADVMSPIEEILATSGMTDYQKELWGIDQTFGGYADQLHSLNADLETSADLERAKAIAIDQVTEAQRKSLAEYQKSLLTSGATTLGIQEQYLLEKEQLLSAGRDATQNKDPEALARLQETVGAFLDVSKQYNPYATGYNADFSLAQSLISKALAASVPHYATGGFHPGGPMLLGEYGPEMVDVGASRVYNASDTRRMISGGGKQESINELKDEIKDLKKALVKVLESVAGHGYRSAKSLDFIERKMIVATQEVVSS
jgi:tape measure domain-containing protein